MHPLRRKKMLTIVSVLLTLGLVIGLVLYALRQNISLFYTPTDLIAGRAPCHHTIRLGGMVVDGSVVRDRTLDVQFQITDYHDTITVIYHGVLPDLFREGKGVVAQGEWGDDHLFQAKTVLAKHDENYMPPEVNDALTRQKIPQVSLPTKKSDV